MLNDQVKKGGIMASSYVVAWSVLIPSPKTRRMIDAAARFA